VEDRLDRIERKLDDVLGTIDGGARHRADRRRHGASSRALVPVDGEAGASVPAHILDRIESHEAQAEGRRRRSRSREGGARTGAGCLAIVPYDPDARRQQEKAEENRLALPNSTSRLARLAAASGRGRQRQQNCGQQLAVRGKEDEGRLVPVSPDGGIVMHAAAVAPRRRTPSPGAGDADTPEAEAAKGEAERRVEPPAPAAPVAAPVPGNEEPTGMDGAQKDDDDPKDGDEDGKDDPPKKKRGRRPLWKRGGGTRKLVGGLTRGLFVV